MGIDDISGTVSKMILDILDRMIDECVKTSSSIYSLENVVKENKYAWDMSMSQIENKINDTIREHVSKENKELISVIKDLRNDLSDIIIDHKSMKKTQERTVSLLNKIQSPSTYIKIFMAFLIGMVTFISTSATLFWKITLWTSKNNEQQHSYQIPIQNNDTTSTQNDQQ